MASGGSRALSGPAKDPNSGRSDRLGVSFFSLDPEGYRGSVPEFPLRPVSAFVLSAEGERIEDSGESEMRRDREAVLWEWAWRLPQAIAWAREPWRVLSVANWVRLQVICETDDAKAADKTALLRLATQIGLSPEGLAANGWQIGTADTVASDDSAPSASGKRRKCSSRDRMPVSLKVVEGGSG